MPALPPAPLVEQIVLACLIFQECAPSHDPDHPIPIDALALDDFDDPAHREIARLLHALHLTGKKINLHNLRTSLPDKTHLEPVIAKITNTFFDPPVLADWSGSPADFPVQVDRLKTYANERKLKQNAALIAEDLAQGNIPPDLAADQLKAAAEAFTNGPQGKPSAIPYGWPEGLPLPIDWIDFAPASLPAPPAIIEGLLLEGDKAILGGSSKTGKSWAALDLAVCVASGIPFLGFKTLQTPTLIVNLELAEFFIHSRLSKLSAAHRLQPSALTLTVWNLRGHHAPVEAIVKALNASPRRFGLIVLDPLYKILGDRKENAAEDMADLMANLSLIAAKHHAAIIYPSHYTKGPQAEKGHMDRISGSGVLARDPDVIITMTANETDDAFTIETTLRNLPPLPRFAIRWDWPLFVRDDAIDPANLKDSYHHPKTSKSAVMLSFLKNGPLPYNTWLQLCKEAGISKTNFNLRLQDFKTRGTVIKCSTSANYYIPLT